MLIRLPARGWEVTEIDDAKLQWRLERLDTVENKKQRVLNPSATQDIRINDLPIGSPIQFEFVGSGGRRIGARSATFDRPGRHKVELANESELKLDAVLAVEPEQLPTQVVIVHNQKTIASPVDENAFGDLVLAWAESCQGNNTVPIKEHNPKVWEEVVAGSNVVRVQYNPARKATVHTDDGPELRELQQIAFQMYDMRPGAVFAKTKDKSGADETLVLESPLIEPTINLISHPALKPFLTRWYQPYLDAWANEPPKDDSELKTTVIGVDAHGVFTLDGKAVKQEIGQLGNHLAKAGYHRDTTCVVISAKPDTPYIKLHWTMWKLGSMSWKDLVLRVEDSSE